MDKFKPNKCFTLAQITKSTFYRYLREMREEDRQKGIIWKDEELAEEADKEILTKEEIINKIKTEGR